MSETSHGQPARRDPRDALRVAESIAADLRQRILGSEATRQLPRQEDLIAEYAVSGPSIREALRILQAEGLITVRRGKHGGAIVHRPSASSAAFALGLSLQGQHVTIVELADSIATVMSLAVGACARREDRADSIVPLLERNLSAADAAEGAQRRTALTRGLLGALVDGIPNAASRLAARASLTVWEVQEDAWIPERRFVGLRPEREDWARDLHRRITAAIAAGDAAEATSLTLERVAADRMELVERFGDRIVDASSVVAVQEFTSR